jgi:phosphoribosylformylglycinamidine synthase subunit PurL
MALQATGNIESVTAPIPEDLPREALHALLAEVGLDFDEYLLLVERLGRQPNKVELGMAGAMWSEHCGYKHSRPLLRKFPTRGPRVLQGPGENAGVVDLGDGWAAALKIESHNHPSAVEPVEGAATGVGGIVRDIFTMGARPVALLNSLRFGSLSEPRTRYLFGGVVAGIGGYGNCIGVPTVGGEVGFDPSFSANPLVNAMCIGLLRSDKVMRASASGAGNPVLLVGADTGRDGIHGATFASDTLGEDALEDRPAVQMGNPFLEKCLMEACLEVLDLGIVVGMQDLGAAGLTSSSVECAARGGAGIEIDLQHVARRERGMNAYEIMLSESQERMLVIVDRGREAEARAVFDRWGLHSDVIGRVTDDGIVRIYDGPELAAELPASLLADEVPIRYVAGAPDPALEALQHPDWDAVLPPEEPGIRYDHALLQVMASPNVASKERVYRTYDHTIGTNTALQPGEADAAVLRIKGTSRGIALTTDCNSRYCYLDPYAGGAHAVAEAARNLSCVGSEPLAVTDCLNFGDPERPEVFYQMESAVNGIADACNALGVPVVSGNVSLYNETSGVAVLPTPVIGMLGLLDDVDRRAALAFREGLAIGLLAPATHDGRRLPSVADDGRWTMDHGRRPTLSSTDERSGSRASHGPSSIAHRPSSPSVGGAPLLGASQYAETCLGLKAGMPPAVDFDAERAVQLACRTAIRRGIVDVAHDCSDGGLAAALAESCIAGHVGASVSLDELDTARPGLRSDVLLFAEEPSRIIVALPLQRWSELRDLASTLGARLYHLGTTGTAALQISRVERALIDLPVEDLKTAWESGLDR